MERLVFYIVAILLGMIQRIPPRLCDAVGRMGGFVAWLLLPGYRRLVQRNLTIAFGEEYSAGAIRRLARQHFSQLGANLLGAAHFFAASEKKVRAHTSLENLEILRAAHARGRGVVLAISHIGNWEMFAQACFYARDLPFGTVFQKVHNRYVDAAITRFRRRLGVRTFDRKSELNSAAAFLRTGGVLGVLVDQHAGPSGIWTPFFGRLASTSPLAASLATRTGAAIVPVAVYSAGPARWRIVIREEVSFAPEATTEEVTVAVTRTLEEQIRQSPLDWFWVHNRWKLPHPEFLLGRTKRGIFLPQDFPAASLQRLRMVVRASNWLGDAVMNLPAVRAIKASRPDAWVAVLTPKKLADFWHSIPEVDEVLALPSRPSLWAAARMLRAGHFEVGIIFPNSLRTALEMWLAGIPRRVGLAGHRRSAFLNQVVPGPKRRLERMRPRHHAKIYLQMVERLGADPATAFPASADSQIRRDGEPGLSPNLIGLCAGAEYGPAKRWPLESYRAVMESISGCRDVEWHLFGVEKDRPLAATLSLNFPGRVVDRTGRTSLGELITELRRLRLLLTNDTGTMHLAAALGVPVVAIFGSTEPLLTGPIGSPAIILREQVECSPCFLRECPLDFRCMKAITPAQVTEAVLQMLEHPGAPLRLNDLATLR